VATKRERRKQAATARFWSGRYSRAATAKAKLQVAYDEVRARIEDLPEADRDAARREIAKVLHRWRR
jgi:hypothetical protein